MGTVRLWVPITDAPSANYEGLGRVLHPDLLDGIAFTAAIPVEIAAGHPDRGKPLVGLCRIEVDEADEARITKVRTPSARDEAIVELCQCPRDPDDNHYMDLAEARRRVEALKAAFTDNGAQELAPDGKTALQDALVEAVRRGLRLADAQEIAHDHAID